MKGIIISYVITLMQYNITVYSLIDHGDGAGDGGHDDDDDDDYHYHDHCDDVGHDERIIIFHD